MRPPFFPAPARRLALSGAVAALMSVTVTAAPVAAQSCGMAGPSRLTVSGDGQTRIAPDMATVQLGVTTQADSAADAMTQNSDQQRAVIEALRGAGIDESQIQTSGLTLNPLMRYDDGQAPTVTGYQASNLVSVRVTDLARVGEVLDAIVSAGANQINGIDFTREDGATALDDARRAAVDDARRKAEVLAESAGLTLGPVIALRDQAVGNGGPRPMMRMEAAMADSVPVQPGELEMSARVEIDYALTGDNACQAPHGRMGGYHGRAAPADTPSDAPEIVPPMPGDSAPAPDEPIVPGIVEPLPEAN